MHHCSTVQQRSQLVSQLLADARQHGLVSQLSRDYQVSRQTLYRWKEKVEEAIQEALSPGATKSQRTVHIQRAVLILFVEAHGSYRGIQTCMKELFGEDMSLETIGSIVNEAGNYAQKLLVQQKPTKDCALALDEQYSSKRGEAYLNIVDAHSSVVWATMPPVAVDAESWTILLWYMQEQGITWKTAASDGGGAIADALRSVEAVSRHQRDVWHVLHVGSQVQGRVDRYLGKLEEQLPTVCRQAERVAQGKKPLGVNPRTDVQAHLAQIKHAEYLASGLRYLLSQLHQLLEIVVLKQNSRQGILNSQERQEELETLLDLLTDLEKEAPSAVSKELQNLHKHVQLALPRLLLFARDLDQIQLQVSQALGEEALHLLGWAWQRRKILGPSTAQLVQGLAPDWHAMASQLFTAWESSVRASSAVENWHSILRPHLAVHRGLTASMLALLAVRHNYHVAPRGLHAGLSPLQRSGIEQQTTDWLTALGYAPLAA
jgi:hypothetical protein